ncbi:MAG: dockerin type I repeat-containing protein [Porcipelethomonas sp.]
MVRGDANLDGKLNVRDAAYIAKMLSEEMGEKLPDTADYNQDSVINVRDSAAIAKYLSVLEE